MSNNALFFDHVVKNNKLKNLTIECQCCGDTLTFNGNENVLDEVLFCEHCHYPINI